MGNSMDMVNGSLGDKIIKYAIPLAVTGILQQLFNAADLAVVGRFSGKAAMAAVGSNAPVIGLLVNLFVGISLGSNVIMQNLSVRGITRIFQKQYIHRWSWLCSEACSLRYWENSWLRRS